VCDACNVMPMQGERGTRVPNATIRELDVEMEFKMTFVYEYSRWPHPLPLMEMRASLRVMCGRLAVHRKHGLKLLHRSAMRGEPWLHPHV
jgi:hypothetical protein